MTYVPDPTQISEPTDDKPAGSAAEEFRKFKQYIQEFQTRFLRAPTGESLNELPPTANRDGYLVFSGGQPNLIPAPSASDASALALSLLSITDAIKGAGQVNFNYALNYVADSLGWVEKLGRIKVEWFYKSNVGQHMPGTGFDDKGAIDAAIAFAKLKCTRNSSPYNTGSFLASVATVEFQPVKYIYSGTMDFSNIYSFCHLSCSQGWATIIHTGTGPCVNIGNGTDVDVMQMRIEGLAFVRSARTPGTSAVKHQGAHCLYIGKFYAWGFETAIHHLGSEEVTYNFERGAIGNCTTGIRIEALKTPANVVWKCNNTEISHGWMYDDVDIGIDIVQATASSGTPGAGGVIDIHHMLFQGISDTGIAIRAENTGEVSGKGWVRASHCWFEDAGVNFVALTKANLELTDSFITGRPGTAQKPFLLNDKVSKLKLKNIEGMFNDSSTVINNALIQRADGTVDGIWDQIETYDLTIKNDGPTNFLKLTNTTTASLEFSHQIDRVTQIVLDSNYPGGYNDYNNGRVLNLTNFVIAAIGNLSLKAGIVDLYFSGNDGTPVVGCAHFRCYFKSTNVAWRTYERSAGNSYELTVSGSGTGTTVTFPSSNEAAWYKTTVSIQVITGQ